MDLYIVNRSDVMEMFNKYIDIFKQLNPAFIVQMENKEYIQDYRYGLSRTLAIYESKNFADKHIVDFASLNISLVSHPGCCAIADIYKFRRHSNVISNEVVLKYTTIMFCFALDMAWASGYVMAMITDSESEHTYDERYTEIKQFLTPFTQIRNRRSNHLVDIWTVELQKEKEPFINFIYDKYNLKKPEIIVEEKGSIKFQEAISDFPF